MLLCLCLRRSNFNQKRVLTHIKALLILSLLKSKSKAIDRPQKANKNPARPFPPNAETSYHSHKK